MIQSLELLLPPPPPLPPPQQTSSNSSHWKHFNNSQQQQQQQQQQFFTNAKLPSNKTNLSRLNFGKITMTNNNDNIIASHENEKKKNYHEQKQNSNKNDDEHNNNNAVAAGTAVFESNEMSYNRDDNDYHDDDHIDQNDESRVNSNLMIPITDQHKQKVTKIADIHHSDDNQRDRFDCNTMSDENECFVLSTSHTTNIVNDNNNNNNNNNVDVDNQENNLNLFNLQKIDQLRPKLITMKLNNNSDDPNQILNYSSDNNIADTTRKCGTEFMMMMMSTNVSSLKAMQNNNNNNNNDSMNNDASSSMIRKKLLTLHSPNLNDNGNRFNSLNNSINSDEITNASMNTVLLSSSSSSSSPSTTTTTKTLANKSSVTHTDDRSTLNIPNTAWKQQQQQQQQQNINDENLDQKNNSSNIIMHDWKNGDDKHFEQIDNSINSCSEQESKSLMDKHTVKYDDNDDNNDNTIMLPKSLPISIPKPVQKSNQQLFGFFGAYHQQQQPIDLDHHHHYHLFHSHDRQTNHHHSQQQQQLSQQNKPINTNNMFISSNSVEEFNQEIAELMEKNQIECEENNGNDKIHQPMSTIVTNGGRRAPVTELLIAAAAVDSSTSSSSYPGDFVSSPNGSLSTIAQIDCWQEWSIDQSCMPFLCDDVDDEPTSPSLVMTKNNSKNNNNNDTESLSIDHSLTILPDRFISSNKRVLDETDIDQWLSDQESSITIMNNVHSNFNNKNNNKKADSSIEFVDFPNEAQQQQQQQHNIIANSKCAKLVTNNKQNFSSQMLPSPKMISSDIVDDNIFEMKEPRTKNKPKLYQPTQSDEWCSTIADNLFIELRQQHSQHYHDSNQKQFKLKPSFQSAFLPVSATTASFVTTNRRRMQTSN
ncbi:hypothetical protein DERP_015269 [Dermatophagoides pteronyssinus]|uniref:Uncharacterized protein n=1 Tax=Dermatophagoides pteronyssinus TaxID=6956 RepID=A0ABQ8JLI9_DERPT|nr:hypothetical protein DERP_015269 [Dermatophagoides pteronyssinus]